MKGEWEGAGAHVSQIIHNLVLATNKTTSQYTVIAQFSHGYNLLKNAGGVGVNQLGWYNYSSAKQLNFLFHFPIQTFNISNLLHFLLEFQMLLDV